MISEEMREEFRKYWSDYFREEGDDAGRTDVPVLDESLLRQLHEDWAKYMPQQSATTTPLSTPVVPIVTQYGPQEPRITLPLYYEHPQYVQPPAKKKIPLPVVLGVVGILLLLILSYRNGTIGIRSANETATALPAETVETRPNATATRAPVRPTVVPGSTQGTPESTPESTPTQLSEPTPTTLIIQTGEDTQIVVKPSTRVLPPINHATAVPVSEPTAVVSSETPNYNGNMTSESKGDSQHGTKQTPNRRHPSSSTTP